MNYILTFLFSISVVTAKFQTLKIEDVDTSNYYQYYSKGENLKGTKLSTARLTKVEIAKIIAEEMESAGYKKVHEFAIMKIDSCHIMLIGHSTKSNFGFVYISPYNLFPKVESRLVTNPDVENLGYDFSQRIENVNGEVDFCKIKKLPPNIIPIFAELYWYQYSDNPKDNSKLITKDFAIKILRQDIKKKLLSAPAP